MATETLDFTALPPGARIHAYEVVSRLGQGGMGTVYKVQRDGKEYALKLSVQVDQALTPEQRAQLDARARREVSTLAAISHPNVVQVRGFDRWPDAETGHLYLVTDLVEGERLYLWQRTHKPSLRNIAGAFIHIADALHELHRHQIFHRDLKSENVLIRQDGVPILIDFGISRQQSAYTLTTASNVIGTPSHLSPDYCRFVTTLAGPRGERYAWRPTDDLHALGFMLYELLTGQAPFSNSEANEWSLLLDIANKVPPRPRELKPALPESLDALVMRLLAKQPSQGFQTGQELVAALNQALRQAGPEWEQPYAPPSPKRDPEFDAHGCPNDAEGHAGPELAALLFEEEAPAAAPPRASGLTNVPAVPAQPKPPGANSSPPAASSFRPPSQVRPAFNPPVAAAQPASQPSANGLPTQLRLAHAQLSTSARSPRQLRLALAGAATAAVLAVILWLTSSPSEKPRTLLAQYDEAQRQPVQPPTTPAVAEPTTAPPPESVASLPVATPPTEAPRHVVDSGLNAPPPARHVDVPSPQAIAHAVPRPASAGKRTDPRVSPHPPATPTVSWLKTAQSLDEPKPPASSEARKLGVPFGTHLRVRLRSNLDSRSASDALVEAVLARPFLLHGEPLLPARTMLYGTTQPNGGRFLIRFTKLRLPDDRELLFSGAAFDTGDGKPGLAPGRKLGAAPHQEDLGAAVARTTANLLLGKVGGSTAADAASAAGQTVLQHDSGATTASQEALLLDAGGDFEIVVNEAF